MKILRWVAFVVLALVALIACVFIGARFGDGPIAMIPGGPLRSGELVAETEVDWTFAADVSEIELQLVDPARSRTVWLVVHGSRAYVPCSLDFPPFKTWHRSAMEDGRAVVRVLGRRYERQLVRVTDEALITDLASRVAAKYRLEGSGRFDPTRLWLFRLDARP
jgi:hypothetical protein